MSSKPTVFVIDDDPAVRESLAALVRSMRLEVETFASGQEFLDAYTDSRPGCVVVDLRMPGMSGLELIETLAQRRAEIPAVMITGYGDVPVAVRAIKAGAIEFLEKPYDTMELRRGIERAIEVDAERRRAAAPRREVEQKLASLTDQERQVLELTLIGKLNKVIASQLGVCLRTVHSRRGAIIKKLGVRNRNELIRLVLSARQGENAGLLTAQRR